MKRMYEITEIEPYPEQGVRNFLVTDPRVMGPVGVAYYADNWAACSGCNSPLRGASGSCVHAQAVMRFINGPRPKKVVAEAVTQPEARVNRVELLRQRHDAYLSVLKLLYAEATHFHPVPLSITTGDVKRIFKILPDHAKCLILNDPLIK